MAEGRQNVNVELAEPAKARLEQLRAWNGMTQKELVSRLIHWFCNQDRVVQQIILGQIPEEIAPDVAVLVLQRMAEGKPTLSEQDTAHLPAVLEVSEQAASTN